MSRNEPIESANSAPCFGIPSILVASDDPTNGLNAVDDLETTRPAEDRPAARAPINKRGHLEKLLQAKLNEFEVKKKSFLSACKELNTSYRDCLNVEGDAKGTENVENFVKNHVHEVYAPNSHVGEFPEPLKVDRKVLKIDLQTNVSEVDTMVNNLGERFCDGVISVADVNNVCYRCLTQIMDKRKFQSIEDVKAHVALALGNGVDSDSIGSELLGSCKEHLKKFHAVLDGKLRDELAARSTRSNAKSRLDALRDELAGNDGKMKILEDRIKILKKEQKDLLDISQSYNTVNGNRPALEKLLKAEQETNSKLREMISVVSRNKVP